MVVEILIAIFNLAYYFMLPGLMLTLLVFKKNEIHVIERIGVGIGLSVILNSVFGWMIIVLFNAGNLYLQNVLVFNSILIGILLFLIIHRKLKLKFSVLSKRINGNSKGD